MRRLHKLRALPPPERRELLEAMLTLAFARIALFMPFRWLAPLLGGVETGAGQSNAVLGADERYAALAVRRAVLRVANRLPWQSSCLVRALAARIMLRRRRLPSVVQLGVGRTAAKFSAHAWVRCGEIDVVGAEGSANFAPIAAFRG